MCRSDDLFRYPGFSCRYRALLPDGNAAPGTFGNDTAGHGQGLTSNNFLQVVQCPSNTPVTTTDPATGIDQSELNIMSLDCCIDQSGMETSATSGMGGAASLYSGNWNGRCGNQNSLPGLPSQGKYHGKEVLSEI